jgi:hypothetical protein
LPGSFESFQKLNKAIFGYCIGQNATLEESLDFRCVHADIASVFLTLKQILRTGFSLETATKSCYPFRHLRVLPLRHKTANNKFPKKNT